MCVALPAIGEAEAALQAFFFIASSSSASAAGFEMSLFRASAEGQSRSIVWSCLFCLLSDSWSPVWWSAGPLTGRGSGSPPLCCLVASGYNNSRQCSFKIFLIGLILHLRP